MVRCRKFSGPFILSSADSLGDCRLFVCLHFAFSQPIWIPSTVRRPSFCIQSTDSDFVGCSVSDRFYSTDALKISKPTFAPLNLFHYFPSIGHRISFCIPLIQFEFSLHQRLDARQFGVIHEVIVDAVHHAARSTQLLLLDIVCGFQIVVASQR